MIIAEVGFQFQTGVRLDKFRDDYLSITLAEQMLHTHAVYRGIEFSDHLC